MKLIIAQGNPGAQYAQTRHNVGFLVLDAFAVAHDASWKLDTKIRAELASTTINGEKMLLVKPHSFYNDTGMVVRSLVDFYKLTPARDVLVVHDELALPFGTIRVREKGSDAGNNGIKSINTHLGGDYWRIRVGVWNEQRNLLDDANFVLSRFSSDEQAILPKLIEASVFPLMETFIAEAPFATSVTHE